MSEALDLFNSHKDLPLDKLKDIQLSTYKVKDSDTHAKTLYYVVTGIIANRSKK